MTVDCFVIVVVQIQRFLRSSFYSLFLFFYLVFIYGNHLFRSSNCCHWSWIFMLDKLFILCNIFKLGSSIFFHPWQFWSGFFFCYTLVPFRCRELNTLGYFSIFSKAINKTLGTIFIKDWSIFISIISSQFRLSIFQFLIFNTRLFWFFKLFLNKPHFSLFIENFHDFIFSWINIS